MRITYYALKPILVGDDQREPGDLVPEARDWPYLTGYLQDGTIAPVLVATLPEEQQIMLLEWDEDQKGPEATSPAPEPEQEPEPEPTPEPEPVKQEGEDDKPAPTQSHKTKQKAVA